MLESTAPITHLEPGAQTAGGRWSRWPYLDYRLQGQRSPSPDRSTRDVMCFFALNPALLVTCMYPSLLLYLSKTNLLKSPATCSHLLPARPLRDSFDHTHLSPPKTAVLQFNHLWMWVEVGNGVWGVEVKTTHYVMYLLIQGS